MYQQILEQVQAKAKCCGRDPQEITLVAVTKYQSFETIPHLYKEGCRHFGESRVQEALPKIPLLPSDCHWHFIGTLQSNKVSKVITPFCLIHAIDSLELAKKISNVSRERDQTTSILLEVKTSLEPSKHGLSANEWRLRLDELNTLPNIKVEGLMTMAPLIENREIVRDCFKQLSQLKREWQPLMREPIAFKELSMGMSRDFLIAIEEGATLLRIGSALFK